MESFTPAPLKPYFAKFDFRHAQLVCTFVPMVLWLGALAVAIIYWRGWGLPLAWLLAACGGRMVKLNFKLNYSLAMRARSTPLPGQPGVDYLVFSVESLETVDRLKVIAEDAGVLTAEADGFRVTTLHFDVVVPFEMFRYEPVLKGGLMSYILVSFEAPDGPGSVRFAANFYYYGDNLNIAGKRDFCCEWALRAIEGMKPASLRDDLALRPPPLPIGYRG